MLCPRCGLKMKVTNTVIADKTTVVRRQECLNVKCCHVINSIEYIISDEEPPRHFGVRSIAKAIREGEIEIPKITIQNGEFSTSYSKTFPKPD